MQRCEAIGDKGRMSHFDRYGQLEKFLPKKKDRRRILSANIVAAPEKPPKTLDV